MSQSSAGPGPGAAFGLWAMGCGALASGAVPRQPAELATLALALVLGVIGWGIAWELAIGTDWHTRRRAAAPEGETQGPPGSDYPDFDSPAPAQGGLPYTRPGSPADRLGRVAARLRAGWRGGMWPAFRAEVLGLLPALALIVIVACFLPPRFGPLYLAMAALAGLGLLWRRRQRSPLGATAVARVGVPWLAGHLALGSPDRASAAMALCFTLAAWGLLRMAGRPAAGGLRLLDGGQALSLVLLVAGRESAVAAVGLGLLVIGQLALQPSLGSGAGAGAPRAGLAAMVVRRTSPWLMAAMLVGALGLR